MKTQWLALAALVGVVAFTPVAQAASCSNVAGTYKISNDQLAIAMSSGCAEDSGPETGYMYVDGSFTITQSGCTLTLSDASGTDGSKFLDLWEGSTSDYTSAEFGTITATLNSDGRAQFIKEIAHTVDGQWVEGWGRCKLDFNRSIIHCKAIFPYDRTGKSCGIRMKDSFTKQ